MCRNLTVLYLYDNQITWIRNLDFASNLTHLYIQNNNITHIDNLHGLQKLSKLWADNRLIASCCVYYCERCVGLLFALQVFRWEQNQCSGGFRGAPRAPRASSGETAAGTSGEVALWPQDSPLTRCMTHNVESRHYTLNIQYFTYLTS